MKANRDLGDKKFESNDLTEWARGHLLPMQAVLTLVGIGMMGVAVFFLVINHQDGTLDGIITGIYLLVLVTGLFILLIAIASSGKIVRVAVHEWGLKFWCANGITNVIAFDDILRISRTPGKISVFLPASPNHANYHFKEKYVTDLTELYEALTTAFEAHEKVKNPVVAPPSDIQNNDQRFRPLSLKNRMKSSVIFSTYLYIALMLAVLISNGFEFTSGTLKIPFYAVIGYLLAKFLYKKRPVNDAGAEVYTLFLSILVISVASFTTDYHTFGNRAFNLILIIFTLIFLGILWWIGVSVIKHQKELSTVLKTLGTHFGYLFSKSKRLRNKEYQRIVKVLQMDCEPERFITEATHFLSRQDVPVDERAFLQMQISYARGVMGDYDMAIQLLQEVVPRVEVDPKAFGYFGKGYLYDTMVRWAFKKGDREVAEIYQELREKHRHDIHDELFPHSQSYEAIINGQFDDAFAYYARRHQVHQERNQIMTTLAKVDEQFEMALIYEQTGEVEKQKNCLQYVVKNGRSSEMAEVARRTLVAMGKEIETIEAVADVVQKPVPKKGNVLPFIIMLIIAIGLWIFVSR